MYAHIGNKNSCFTDFPFDLFTQFSTTSTMISSSMISDDLDIVPFPNTNIINNEEDSSELLNAVRYYCQYRSSTGRGNNHHTGSHIDSFASNNCHNPSTTTHLIMEEEGSSASHFLHRTAHESSLYESSVRKVFSTGDLDGVNSCNKERQKQQEAESPLATSSEHNMIIEGMARATRYSPEQKKERIERYRRKKNHRNFNRTIQYSCRKMLADNRPRVKGRFVRNGEILPSESSSGMMIERSCDYGDDCMVNDQWRRGWHDTEYDKEDEEDGNWANLLGWIFTS